MIQVRFDLGKVTAKLSFVGLLLVVTSGTVPALKEEDAQHVLKSAVWVPTANSAKNKPRCVGSGTARKWIEKVEKAGSVNAIVLAEADKQGGTPLCWGNDVVFVAHSTEKIAPRVVGDFNDGGYERSDLFGVGTMKQIGESNWYFLKTSLPSNARIEYRIKKNKTEGLDPLNPAKANTFGTLRSVYEGIGIRRLQAESGTLSKGRLVEIDVTSVIKANSRKISVYLPAGYDPKGKKLPTIYIKDGRRFMGEAGVPGILDKLIDRDLIPPVIAVFVDAVDRAREYGTSSKYRKFFINELITEVEKRFASGGSKERRALFGASRGALAAVDLKVQYPEHFGFVTAMSPALKPLPILDEIRKRNILDGVFLVLVSMYDTPNLVQQGRSLGQVLQRGSSQTSTLEVPIDHSVGGWSLWMETVLRKWNSSVLSEPGTRNKKMETQTLTSQNNPAV